MIKIDLHCHSIYSQHPLWGNEAFGTPRQMIKKAVAEGFNGLAITDHDSVKGTLEGIKCARNFKDFLLVPGTEVSSAGGHILAIGIKECVPKNLSVPETIDKIHDLGGMAIAAHPYAGFPRFSSLKDAAKKYRFDAIEVINGGAHVSQNRKAYRVAKELDLPYTAGSDSHYWKDLGLIYNIIESSLSVPSLLNAIKKKKIIVRGRPLGLYSRMRLGTKKVIRSLSSRI